MKSINFKTVKVRLKHILNDDVNYTSLFDAIKRTNELTKIGSHFIKAFILDCIKNDYKLEHINKSFIRMAFSVLCVNEEKKKGRPHKDKSKLLDDLTKFYNGHFNIYTDITIPDSRGLSYILNDIYSSMYEEITNHIVLHFDKMIWKFIKTYFPKKKNVKSKEHTKKLLELKNHLLNRTYYEDIPENDFLNNWLCHYRLRILPPDYVDSKFESEVKKNNFKFIKCMHYINSFLQYKTVKSYHLLPLRSKSYDNYIKINTSALIEILHSNNRTILDKNMIYYFTNSGNTNLQEFLWNSLFKLKNENNNYKYKFINHSFNYELCTDGYAVSLNFISNEDVPKKEQKKANFKKGRIESNKLKNAKPEEYDSLIKEKNDKKIDAEIEYKRKKAEEAKQSRLAFKKLSKEEQDKKKAELTNKSEFPYIEDILKFCTVAQRKEIEEAIEKGEILYIDPGKRSIFYIMGPNKKKIKEIKLHGLSTHIFKDHKFLDYTSKTRRIHLRTKDYEKKREDWKSKPNSSTLVTLEELEKELSEFNSKTVDLMEFYKYINKKFECFNLIKKYYDTTKLQKLQWYAYLNKIHHEKELMDFIENEFGSNILIIIGDWSNKGRVRYMSTPNLSLKRKLKERFTKVYLIDEYLTSKIHNRYHVRCKNLRAQSEYEELLSNISKDKDNPKFDGVKKKLHVYKKRESWNIKRKVHAVLTFKVVRAEIVLPDGINYRDIQVERRFSGGCINRDKNSTFNMKTIVRSLIKTNERPVIFRR